MLNKLIIGAAAALGVLLIAAPATADHVSTPVYTPVAELDEADKSTEWMAGDAILAGAFCNSTDVQLVRDMSDAVLRSGWDGYIKWINGPHQCYDFRIPSHYVLGVRQVNGTLLEKLWTFEAEEETIEVWRFMDTAQQIGFTWLSPKPIPGVES